MPSKSTPKASDYQYESAHGRSRSKRTQHHTPASNRASESDSFVDNDLSFNASSTSVAGESEQSSFSSQHKSNRRSPNLRSPASNASPSLNRSNQLYPDLDDLSNEINNSYYKYDLSTELDESGDSGLINRQLPSKLRSPSSSISYESVRSRRALNSAESPAAKHQPTSSPGSSQKNSSNDTRSSLIILAIVLVLLMIGFGIYIISGNKSPPFEAEQEEQNEQTQFEVFRMEMKNLHERFPNQNSRLWKTVVASSRHILIGPNSTYPSVIIIASQAGAPRLSSCLAEKIAAGFLKARGHYYSKIPYTDIDSLKSFAAHEQKLLLDKNVQSTFHLENGKAFVIRNLQSLSPHAALLLHGLCDGDNAPFKDVMILMTLEVTDAVRNLTAHQMEDHLARLWTTPEVEYDKVAALMSRISNSLVLLTNEDPSVLDEVCPDLR